MQAEVGFWCAEEGEKSRIDEEEEKYVMSQIDKIGRIENWWWGLRCEMAGKAKYGDGSCDSES